MLTHPAVLYVIIFAVTLLLHWPLLRLPYLWDEAYFVTVAREVMLTGHVIPSAVASNGHPPLVFLYLATAWKLFGYVPVVTRVAMLAVAAFGLVELFRLGRILGDTRLGVACAACTAVYPVFFAQSSMAHLDVPAAALTFAGLRLYLQQRLGASVSFFSLAALAKETAVLAPFALILLELGRAARHRTFHRLPLRRTAALALPIVALAAWFGYHWLLTGYAFGNPQFFQENARATLNPAWVLATLALRIWHLTGHMHLFALTLPALLAYWPRPSDEGQPLGFGAVVSALAVVFGLSLSMLGGAPLARYLLPVVPLVICMALAVVRRRWRRWALAAGAACLLFLTALIIRPVYPASAEDSLAYRDVIALHQRAVDLVRSRSTGQVILASWPIPDLLATPHLGYTTEPLNVLEIANLTEEEVRAARDGQHFDVAVLLTHKRRPFLTDLLPPVRLLRERLGRKQYLTLHASSALLGGRVIHYEERGPAAFVVVEMPPVP